LFILHDNFHFSAVFSLWGFSYPWWPIVQKYWMKNFINKQLICFIYLFCGAEDLIQGLPYHWAALLVAIHVLNCYCKKHDKISFLSTMFCLEPGSSLCLVCPPCTVCIIYRECGTICGFRHPLGTRCVEEPC
jgi:hypothetical protein